MSSDHQHDGAAVVACARSRLGGVDSHGRAIAAVEAATKIVLYSLHEQPGAAFRGDGSKRRSPSPEKAAS